MLKLAYLDLSELSPYTFRGLRDVRMLCIENSDLATVRENAFKGEICKLLRGENQRYRD